MADPIDAYVTGMGMVTSLGLDVATAAAAARAGITRSRELDYFLVRSADDPSHQGVVGHEIPDVTRGFEGTARLLRILQAALADLRRQTSSDTLGKRVAFYLSLPDPARVAPVSASTDPDDARARGERVLRAAAAAAGWPGVPAVGFVSTSGHTGVAEAVIRGVADLRSGRIDTAIVGGVDSLLEERTLAWLDECGRLKTPRLPAGVPPGEAGALLALRTTRPTDGPIATLRAVTVGTEPHPIASGDPSHGDGLLEALGGIGDAAAWTQATSAWIVTDHNGEPYRALEWGHALVRLVARWPAFTSPALWYPAASFGDTAGASGAVALCLVARAFVRGYAPADHAAIVSSADGSTRSAMLIGRPGGDSR